MSEDKGKSPMRREAAATQASVERGTSPVQERRSRMRNIFRELRSMSDDLTYSLQGDEARDAAKDANDDKEVVKDTIQEMRRAAKGKENETSRNCIELAGRASSEVDDVSGDVQGSMSKVLDIDAVRGVIVENIGDPVTPPEREVIVTSREIMDDESDSLFGFLQDVPQRAFRGRKVETAENTAPRVEEDTTAKHPVADDAENAESIPMDDMDKPEPAWFPLGGPQTERRDSLLPSGAKPNPRAGAMDGVGVRDFGEKAGEGVGVGVKEGVMGRRGREPDLREYMRTPLGGPMASPPGGPAPLGRPVSLRGPMNTPRRGSSSTQPKSPTNTQARSPTITLPKSPTSTLPKGPTRKPHRGSTRTPRREVPRMPDPQNDSDEEAKRACGWLC